MGCCKSNFEISDEALTTLDNLNTIDQRNTQIDDGFGDLSLDSHQSGKYHQMEEISKSKLGDSQVYNTRSTSISLHRNDLESAFLRNSGILRKNTMDFLKPEETSREIS